MITRVVALFAFVISLGASAANANETADMHQQARFGSKICMVTHQHHGEGSMPSKNGAQAAAIRRWEWFTRWEYGPRWGSFRKARGQRMRCYRSRSRWTCMVDAHPCR
ncbi:MAG: hypothetical protein AAFV26_03220 [Pseudomonadota bacterium]